MKQLKRKVILLSGNGGTAFDKNTIEKYHAKLQGLNGVDVFAIGNGVKGIGQKEIYELAELLADIKVGQPATLIIQSHGTMEDGQFSFCIGENNQKITSKELFLLIRFSLGTKPIDIFTTACHGGGALADKDFLPKGSQYACLTDKHHANVGTDFRMMMNDLEKFEGDLSAYNLMQFFAANYLQNRHAPSLGVSGGAVCEMDSYLTSPGYGYGDTTEQQAITRTSGIELDEVHMAKSKNADYKTIFDKIKIGELVTAKEYGTAVSIVLNHKKHNFVNQQFILKDEIER